MVSQEQTYKNMSDYVLQRKRSDLWFESQRIYWDYLLHKRSSPEDLRKMYANMHEVIEIGKELQRRETTDSHRKDI